jgi:NADH-quinone oxidoreductase subunit B
MGLEPKTGTLGVVTTSLEQVVKRARTKKILPKLFGIACCAIEIIAAQAPA